MSSDLSWQFIVSEQEGHRSSTHGMSWSVLSLSLLLSGLPHFWGLLCSLVCKGTSLCNFCVCAWAPLQFGGGDRVKPPHSVSPGPALGHRPMLGAVRETLVGFGAAPRKDLYQTSDTPGPGYYRANKEFGAGATGGHIGKDPSGGTNVFVGDQFSTRGTLGPALLLTHRSVGCERWSGCVSLSVGDRPVVLCSSACSPDWCLTCARCAARWKRRAAIFHRFLAPI